MCVVCVLWLPCSAGFGFGMTVPQATASSSCTYGAGVSISFSSNLLNGPSPKCAATPDPQDGIVNQVIARCNVQCSANGSNYNACFCPCTACC